jgi:hypothetical protein
MIWSLWSCDNLHILTYTSCIYTTLGPTCVIPRVNCDAEHSQDQSYQVCYFVCYFSRLLRTHIHIVGWQSACMCRGMVYWQRCRNVPSCCLPLYLVQTESSYLRLRARLQNFTREQTRGCYSWSSGMILHERDRGRWSRVRPWLV